MAKKALKASLHTSIKKQPSSSKLAYVSSADTKRTKKCPPLPSSKQNRFILEEHTLSPRAKELLEELSQTLGLCKEVVASLAITLYRMNKDQK